MRKQANKKAASVQNESNERQRTIEELRAEQDKLMCGFLDYLRSIGLMSPSRLTPEERAIDDARQAEQERKWGFSSCSPQFWVSLRKMAAEMGHPMSPWLYPSLRDAMADPLSPFNARDNDDFFLGEG
jgi:hypothetical protein